MASSDRSSLPQRLFVAFWLGATLCVAPPAFANTLPEIQRLIRQAQYPQALEKADAYLASRPGDAQGRFFKGLILTEMNRTPEAIAEFTRLTEDYPELPEPYNNLAVLYAQQKQYDRARTALEMAIRTHPAYAVAYENLGDVYARLASQAYDRALQLDSANATAQNKLALIRELVSAPTQAAHARPGNATVAARQPPAPPVQTAPPVAPPAAVKPPVATVATATPGATKPAPVPGASASVPTADAQQEVAKTLADWIAAWARQDVKAYLAFYAPGFQPPKGVSRKEWEAERKERISRPAWIKITYDKPAITIDGNRASVRFRQHYKASSFKGDSEKTLALVRSGNRWLIADEDAR